MLFKNFKIIYKDGIREGDVLVRGEKIESTGDNIICDGVEIIEGNGRYLSPGYIDTHIHGASGCDTMDASFESLSKISLTLAERGTTSFLPTTMTEKKENIIKSIRAVKEAMGKILGARIAGIHMEGPYIAPNYTGAQDKTYIRKPSEEDFKSLAGDSEDLIKTVTLAPEREGSHELIKYLRKKGINVSLGHTGAIYSEVSEGIKTGINHATHLFNAMTGIHHREPGAAGAVLDHDITAEIISDGIHVMWPIIRLAVGIKGTEKIILVTDAMMACGMKDGAYTLGGQEVFKKGAEVRLKSGSLAGSVLTMEDAVKNVSQNTDIPLHEIINMASRNPSVLIGTDAVTGEIKEGLLADLLILDSDLSVKEVYIAGERFKK